jgi:hypothetical protein
LNYSKVQEERKKEKQGKQELLRAIGHGLRAGVVARRPSSA